MVCPSVKGLQWVRGRVKEVKNPLGSVVLIPIVGKWKKGIYTECKKVRLYTQYVI